MLKINFETNYPGNCIYLMNEEAVQSEFLRIVENISKGEEPFWDDASLKIIEVVDGATREGDYTVVSPHGRGCIHSLSHECQAALILTYGQKRFCIPRRFRMAILSTETLKCLNNLDINIEILLPVEAGDDWILEEQVKAIELLAAHEQFEVEGEMIGLGIDGWPATLRAMVNEVEYFHRGMDPAEEARGYRLHMNLREENRVYSNLEQELNMYDFLQLFGVGAPEYEHFHVVNTCRTLRKDNEDGACMLILLDEKGVHQYNISRGNTGHTLVNQILRRCSESRGNVVALLTECDPETFRTDKYPEQTEMGFIINFDRAEIKICHKYLAIKEFHRLYIAAFGEWVEEDD